MQITLDINISIKRTSKICLLVVKKFWVLLLGIKNQNLGTALEENVCRKKEDKIWLKHTGGHITIKRNGSKEFLDDKGAFYNHSKSDDGDDDDDDDDGNYKENMEAAVCRYSSK